MAYTFFGEDINLNKNDLLLFKPHPITTVNRLLLGASLGVSNKGIFVTDVTDNIHYWWDGFMWQPIGVDVKVKVSSNDTTAGYLTDKLIAGTAITITEINNGGDEDFQISHTDTSSFSGLNTSGAQVIDVVTTDTMGHLQSITTRNLTLADIGGIETEDSITVDFSGDGTSLDPLTADVIVSEQINNAVTVLPDGIFVPQIIQNGLIYGGVVTWVTGLTFNISAAGYYINGVFYESPATTITLDPADSIDPRIDLFIVDTTSTASVLTGIPSSTPAEPGIDIGMEIRLSSVLIPAGASDPGIGYECVYQENTEWTQVITNPRINTNSLTNPCDGVKDIEATNAINFDNVKYQRPGGPIDINANYTVLTFKINVKAGWPTGTQLMFRWWNGASTVGSPVNLAHGAFGFNKNLVGSCQSIAIPITAFSVPLAAIVDTLMVMVTTSSTLPGFYLDSICLQDIAQPIIVTSDDIKVKVSSNDTTTGYLTEKIIAGAGITVTEINNGGDEDFQIAHTDTSSFAGLDTSGAQIIDVITADTFGHILTVTTRDLTLTDLGYTPPVESDPIALAKTITLNVGTGITRVGAATQALSANPTWTIDHVDSSAFAGLDTSGAQVIDVVTVDTYGHVENITTRDLTIADLGGETDPIALAKLITVNQGGGIIVTGTAAQALSTPPVWTIAHADTSSVVNLDTSTAQVIDTLTFDTYGHVQTVTTRNLTIADLGGETDPLALAKVITINQGGGITITGTAGQALSTPPTWTVAHSDTSSVANLDTSGAQVIDLLTFDTYGHVQSVTTRNLTLSDLGYVAPNITAQNGLTEITTDTIELGGSLLHDTIITSTDPSWNVSVHGIVNGSAAALTGFTSGSGWGVFGTSGSGVGVRAIGGGSQPALWASSSLGTGVYGTSVDSFGGHFASTNQAAAYIIATNNYGAVIQSLSSLAIDALTANAGSNNDIQPVMQLERGGFNTGLDELGTSIDTILGLKLSFTSATASRLVTRWTDAATASKKSRFELHLSDSTVARKLALLHTGQLVLDTYGDGIHTGTPTYVLASDTNGNIIEVDSATLGADKFVASAAFTGTTTKTLTLTLNDASTVTASFTDLTTSGGSGLSDAYISMTDGPNVSSASGGDTFKFRSANSYITLLVTDDDVTHGDNLLITFSEEALDDRVANLLVAGTGIGLSYNDAGNTLTITNSAPDQTVVLTSGTGISVTGTYPNFTIASTITQYTDEMAQDTVATLIQNGTGITWSYNDALNTLTPTVTITQYTDEMAQDAVGTILVDSDSIDFTYDDATPSVTAIVKTDWLYDRIRQLTVIFQVGTTDMPADGETVFQLKDCDGNDVSNATVKLYIERRRMTETRDFTIDTSTGIITLTDPLIDTQWVEIDIYPLQTRTVCVVGTGAPVGFDYDFDFDID